VPNPGKETVMSLERHIDSLIEAGWEVIESDFSPNSIDRWRSQASDCITYLMGPDDGYARYLQEHVSRAYRDDALGDDPWV
jgi:hypothetical protein